MVEGARLESVYTVKGIKGSNPFLSAKKLFIFNIIIFINFYNKQDWQTAEIPSMNGHGNARSIAKIYDIFVNDLILEKKILLSKSSIKKCLTETTSRIDESLMFPIRWSQVGLILRGGWLFGKNKESFGHNGWGGSLGFADPVLGIGVAYTTNKINPTMASDQRIINLLKKFYEII